MFSNKNKIYRSLFKVCVFLIFIPQALTTYADQSSETHNSDLSEVAQAGWVLDTDTWYYLDMSGKIQTGWLNLNNVWYYLDATGKMQTGWLNLNNVWYYLDATGKMQTG